MKNSFETESDALETETLAGLAENIVYRLPGCTDLMVRKALQDVYRDFCRRSCCLRTARHFHLSPKCRHYPVSASNDAFAVDSVVQVTLGRRVLEQEADYRIKGVGRNLCVELTGRVYVPDYEVACPEDVHVDVVEVPRLGAEYVTDGFVEKYGDAIVSGVLSRLMSMTGRAWTDVAQAAIERQIYESAVGEARLNYYVGSASGNGDAGFGIDTSDLI